MLEITRQSIENLIERLSASDELEQCQDEVSRMLEIESELLWWAESGKCCKWQAKAHFDGRIQLLEDILDSLNEGNITQASSLLTEYANQLDKDKAGIILS